MTESEIVAATSAVRLAVDNEFRKKGYSHMMIENWMGITADVYREVAIGALKAAEDFRERKPAR